MCQLIYATITRCEKYSQGVYIPAHDVGKADDTRCCQPAHLVWPTDLAAFELKVAALMNSKGVERPDYATEGPLVDKLWKECWPDALGSSTVDALKPLLAEHFASTSYLYPSPSPEKCKSCLLTTLAENPFPTKLSQDRVQLPKIKYPPLPPSVSFVDHPFILGWAYDRDWLRCFLEAFNEQSGRKNTPYELMQYQTLGWARLQARIAPFRDDSEVMFSIVGVHPDLPILDDVIIDACYDQLPIVPIISITCTASFYHYRKRPSEEEYRWLVTLLGEPSWFRYPYSRKRFMSADLY